ncbi:MULTISPECIES: DUF2247 family protein [Dyella]|uniref:DUF2247 family protein n=2 Tax=Dyella TaxID=231454 RepID=A0A4R0YU64_9GAMM|nr:MULTISPECIES: DUF2247 family protein [Dyella]TBR39596.1 DUF2247 family protein [Dyella terrae]TCI12822.1 DUF2247 family protein [Dyella soli]
MRDEVFKIIVGHGLADWGVAYHGVAGVPGFSCRLSDQALNRFASETLTDLDIDDPLLVPIVEIATGANMDTREIEPILWKICQSLSTDLIHSMRVWRAGSLEAVISTLESDPIYGLSELSGFWSNWGWPYDSPDCMSFEGSGLSVNEYYSDSNFARVLKEHEAWLDSEISILRTLGVSR